MSGLGETSTINGHVGLSIAIREMRCAMYRSSRKKEMAMHDGQWSWAKTKRLLCVSLHCNAVGHSYTTSASDSSFLLWFVLYPTFNELYIFAFVRLFFLTRWGDEKTKHEKKVRVWSGSTTEIKKAQKKKTTHC